MSLQKSLMGNKVLKIFRRFLYVLLSVVTKLFLFANLIPSFRKTSYGGYDV